MLIAGNSCPVLLTPLPGRFGQVDDSVSETNSAIQIRALDHGMVDLLWSIGSVGMRLVYPRTDVLLALDLHVHFSLVAPSPYNTQQATSLIQSCLLFAPERRSSLETLLDHPWVNA